MSMVGCLDILGLFFSPDGSGVDHEGSSRISTKIVPLRQTWKKNRVNIEAKGSKSVLKKLTTMLKVDMSTVLQVDRLTVL